MEALNKMLKQMPRSVGTYRSNPDQLKVDAINETVGELGCFDCTVCKNKGYVAVLQDDGSVVCRECECMPRRRSLRQIEKSGLRPTLDIYTFDTYETPKPWQTKAKADAKKYLTDADGKWFLACGSVGSGKTHLCTAICGELLKAGIGVRYMLWRDEVGRLKACVNDNDEYNRLIKPLKKTRVLYIDDFFKTERGVKPTSADINIAFEILNSRYADRELITIISTEKSPEELLDIDEAVGSRVYERSRDYVVRIEGEGKNWRLRA